MIGVRLKLSQPGAWGLVVGLGIMILVLVCTYVASQR